MMAYKKYNIFLKIKALDSTSSAKIKNGAVLLTCFTNEENISFSGLNGVYTSYCVEASSGVNPMTGDAYPITNPMQNTTAFAQDKLYIEDMPNRCQIATLRGDLHFYIK